MSYWNVRVVVLGHDLEILGGSFFQLFSAPLPGPLYPGAPVGGRVVGWLWPAAIWSFFLRLVPPGHPSSSPLPAPSLKSRSPQC